MFRHLEWKQKLQCWSNRATNIWCGREFLTFEKLVTILKDLQTLPIFKSLIYIKVFVHSPKHQRLGKRIFGTEWGSSSGAWWMWCRVRDVLELPNLQHLSNREHRRAEPHQTRLEACCASLLSPQVLWEQLTDVLWTLFAKNAPPPERPASKNHLLLTSPKHTLRKTKQRLNLWSITAWHLQAIGHASNTSLSGRGMNECFKAISWILSNFLKYFYKEEYDV